MKGLPFRSVVSDPRKAAKGKLPQIECEGKSICDSSAILDYCERKFPDPMDAQLNRRQRAISNALKAMLEEQLYFVMLWLFWVNPEGAAFHRPIIIELGRKLGYPAFVAPLMFHFLRFQFRRYLWGQGLGRHDPDTILSVGIGNIEAVTVLLGDNDYIHGSAPTTIDPVACAFLIRNLWCPLESRLKQAVQSHHNLVSYCERIRTRYYADGGQRCAADA